MKLHFHNFKINERERDNGSKNYHHYMRRFLHIYTIKKVEKEGRLVESERQIFSGSFSTIVKKKDRNFSINFHVGNAGSETPFDGNLILFGCGFYWGISSGRKLAQWITNGRKEKSYETRDISFWTFDGRLYTSWWVDQNLWDSRAKRPAKWRSRSYRIRPADIIWGEKRYSYEDIDSFDTEIVMPEGSYPVTIKLQRVTLGRSRQKESTKEHSWSLDVDAPNGIPSHYDRSGGWKGDRTYGFGMKFRYPNKNEWQQDAINAVTAWVYEQRAATGFREPQEMN